MRRVNLEAMGQQCLSMCTPNKAGLQKSKDKGTQWRPYGWVPAALDFHVRQNDILWLNSLLFFFFFALACLSGFQLPAARRILTKTFTWSYQERFCSELANTYIRKMAGKACAPARHKATRSPGLWSLLCQGFSIWLGQLIASLFWSSFLIYPRWRFPTGLNKMTNMSNANKPGTFSKQSCTSKLNHG